MRLRGNEVALLGLLLVSLATLAALVSSCIVLVVHPVIGFVMLSTTLTPALVCLVVWGYILRHRKRKLK